MNYVLTTTVPSTRGAIEQVNDGVRNHLKAGGATVSR
jgi:hypothetical protein